MSKVHRRQKNLFPCTRQQPRGCLKGIAAGSASTQLVTIMKCSLFLSAFKLNTQSWFTQETVPLTEQKQWDRTWIHAPQLVQLQDLSPKYLLQPQMKATANNKPQRGENKTAKPLWTENKAFQSSSLCPEQTFAGQSSSHVPVSIQPLGRTCLVGTQRPWGHTDRDHGDTETVAIHRQGL